uniref:NADH-ubiquinone oxidoreductase chain 4L n=1 Tax=Salamandrina terdigitata TaxID=305979 RepID=B8R7C9_9SALA|nr:NADH dehydrogenase subunit 4L [Salamandrina terdigitata]
MLSTFFTFSSSFTIGTMGLMLHRMHLLSALLCLEGMMLTLFIAISLWTAQTDLGSYFLIPYYSTFSACEAGMGLALMVATTRTHGTDHLKNLNLLQC